MASCTNHLSLNPTDRCSHWSITSPPGPTAPKARGWPAASLCRRRREAAPQTSWRCWPAGTPTAAPPSGSKSDWPKRLPRDPLAALGLLVMLRPELEAVRDRLVHSGRITSLEAETDAVAAAWEVVTRRPPPVAGSAAMPSGRRLAE